jgi:hypothetical protein
MNKMIFNQQPASHYEQVILRHMDGPADEDEDEDGNYIREAFITKGLTKEEVWILLND